MKRLLKAFIRPFAKMMIRVQNTRTGFCIPSDVYIPTSFKMLFGRYEAGPISMLLTLLPKGGIFVDVGANIGYISRKAAIKLGHNGKIFAFEPNQEVYQVLRQNMQPFKGAVTANLGLSNTNGRKSFWVGNNRSMGSLNEEFPNVLLVNEGEDTLRKIEVEIAIGDEVLLGIDDTIDAIKIDVEGHEYEVLDGLRKTIKLRRVKSFFIEINPRAQSIAGHDCQEIFDFLKKYEYIPFGTEGAYANVRLTSHKQEMLLSKLGKRDFTTVAFLLKGSCELPDVG